MELIVLHHPGHTKGSCSFLFDVKDDHRSYRVLIANMPTILSETRLSGMPAYPNVGKDYAYTLNELPKLLFDLWLCPHAEQFNLHQKHQPGDPYRPEAFMDRKGYDSTVNDLQKAYLKRLNEQ
jgi:metallo-beta-lactamase class B